MKMREQMIKKLLFIIGIAASVVAIFMGGLYFGTRLGALESELHVSILDEYIAEAVSTHSDIAQLDEGQINRLRSSLNIQLDGDIINLEQLISNCPDSERKADAKRILVRIAKHRKKYPVSID